MTTASSQLVKFVQPRAISVYQRSQELEKLPPNGRVIASRPTTGSYHTFEWLEKGYAERSTRMAVVAMWRWTKM
jgi:hypothetical protein